MKKFLYTLSLTICLSFLGINSTVFASGNAGNETSVYSTNPDKQHLSVTEYPTPYTQITTFPDGSKTVIDFSKATFFDKEGNLIESDLITPFADGTTGGDWNIGSGYRCVKNIEVYVKSLLKNIDMRFKADFCLNQGGFDEITRVYNERIETYEWEILAKGVFRQKETHEYSAYGGIKVKARYKEGGNQTTAYVYLRVKEDRYWVDAYY